MGGSSSCPAWTWPTISCSFSTTPKSGADPCGRRTLWPRSAPRSTRPDSFVSWDHFRILATLPAPTNAHWAAPWIRRKSAACGSPPRPSMFFFLYIYIAYYIVYTYRYTPYEYCRSPAATANQPTNQDDKIDDQPIWAVPIFCVFPRFTFRSLWRCNAYVLYTWLYRIIVCL